MKKLLLFLVVFLPLSVFAETSQEQWIEALHQCESQGRDYITILDTNNKNSYGGLQYQLDTFMGFGKQYGILPESFTNKEGLLLIHNISVQKAIARRMLDDGLERHWLNCVKRIGYSYPIQNALVDS